MSVFIFLESDWVQEIVHHSDVRKINPTGDSLSQQKRGPFCIKYKIYLVKLYKFHKRTYNQS